MVRSAATTTWRFRGFTARLGKDSLRGGKVAGEERLVCLLSVRAVKTPMSYTYLQQKDLSEVVVHVLMA